MLEQWSEQLRIKWTFKRWLHRDDYHITIKFLGECDYQKANNIKKLLQSIALTSNPFSLSISGLDTFDNKGTSKILWAGVHGQLSELHQLQQHVDHEMQTLGFEKEKNIYQPHVTLARNYTSGLLSKEQLAKAIHIKEDIISWEAKELVLYQTHLGQSPAYQPLAVYPFTRKKSQY